MMMDSSWGGDAIKRIQNLQDKNSHNYILQINAPIFTNRIIIYIIGFFKIIILILIKAKFEDIPHMLKE